MPVVLEGLEAPYYAVIFTAVPGEDTREYGDTVARMLELVADQPGFLGVEAANEGERRDRRLVLAGRGVDPRMEAACGASRGAGARTQPVVRRLCRTRGAGRAELHVLERDRPRLTPTPPHTGPAARTGQRLPRRPSIARTTVRLGAKQRPESSRNSSWRRRHSGYRERVSARAGALPRIRFAAA